MRAVSYLNHKRNSKSGRLFNPRRWLLGWGVFVSFGVSLAAGPLLAKNSSVMDASKRQELQDLYNKEIPLLEQYIQKYPDGDRAAVSMFRLAEAYSESAKFAQINNQDSRASLYTQKAINVLEKLRRTQPYYERLDEALLLLATTYMDQGNNKKAGPVLAEIADRFPNSPMMKQVSYLLGDYYADQNKLHQARTYYEKAAKNKDSQAYAYYKLAWVAIQQDQPGVALKDFEKVLYINQDENEKNFDYSRDSAREMVWPALEVYGSSKVIPYLEKTLQNVKLLKISLSILAQGLSDKGEYKLASKTFQYLTTRFPQDPQMDNWVSGELDSEEKLGRANHIVDLVSRLNGNSMSSEKLQSKIYSSAKKYHALAQAEKNHKKKAQLYDQAIAYYKAFNRMGLDTPRAHETQFYMGDALYARGYYRQALEAYKAAALTTNDKQKDAAWNWYLTAEKLAPGFKYNGSTFKQADPIDEKFLEAARYVAGMDSMDIAKRRKASYQAARLVYQLNDFERALPIFKSLAKQYPTSKEGKLSAQLVLDIYNLRKDYKSVAQYAHEFGKTTDSGTKSELSVLEQKAVFKTIQSEEAQAKSLSDDAKAEALKQVAEKYIQFAHDYPKSSFVDGSVWAAVQLYATVASIQNDKTFESLRASFQLLVQKYSRSQFVPKAIKMMGDFLAFIRPAPSIVQAFSNYRDDWYHQMRSEAASKRGALGMIVYQLSTDTQKRNLEHQFLRLRMTDDNRTAIAYAKFRLIQNHKKRLARISLDRLKILKSHTKRKIKKLNDLQREVTDFVKIGEAKLAVESLRLLGGAYADFAQDLRHAPVPTSLKGDNLQKYKNAVKQKAASFDQKADEAKALAEKTATDLGVSS